jgi:hypothetical protein
MVRLLQSSGDWYIHSVLDYPTSVCTDTGLGWFHHQGVTESTMTWSIVLYYK